MSTAAELEAQRNEITKTLSDVREKGTANADAIAAVGEGLAQIRQSMDAISRAALTSRQGSDGESAFYADAVDEKSVKARPECYLTSDAGAVQLFGHKTAEGAHAWGLLDDPSPMDSKQRELQRSYEDLALAQAIIAKGRGVRGPVSTPKLAYRFKRAAAAMPDAVARIFADSSAIGSDFLPTAVSPEFEREVLAQNNLMSIFRSMTHPGGTLTIPYLSGHLQAFNHAIPTGDDPSNDALSSLGDGSNDIKTKATAVGAQVHRDAEEDAIIAVLPQLRQDMAQAIAFADDNRLFNGDTAGTQDDLVNWDVRGRMAVTTNDATHQLRQWDGLRKLALAGGASSSADLNAAQTYAGIATLWNLLGIEQLMDASGGTRAVIFVTPEWFFSKMLFLAEFQGWDDIGPFAALLSGMIGGMGEQSVPMLPNQVGFLAGRFPVCLAYTLTSDLNASGVYDDTTTDRSSIVVADRTRYEEWRRPGETVETDVEIRNNTVTVVGRKRNTFREKRLGTGQYGAVLGYNLTT